MEFFSLCAGVLLWKKVIYGIIIDRGNNYEEEDKRETSGIRTEEHAKRPGRISRRKKKKAQKKKRVKINRVRIVVTVIVVVLIAVVGVSVKNVFDLRAEQNDLREKINSSHQKRLLCERN